MVVGFPQQVREDDAQGDQSTDGEPRRQRPEDDIEAHGAEEVACGQEERTQPAQEPRKHLGGPSSAEVRGDQRGQDHVDAAEQRRGDGKGGDAVAEGGLLQAVERGYEGRVVDVSPGQVMAALQVVELVAVRAIEISGGRLRYNLGCGQNAHESPRHSCP